MKSLNFLLVILLFALLVSCTAEKKNKLEGAWELVSARHTTPATTNEFTQADWKQIKLITKSHFVFVRQGRNDPAKAFLAGGGKYTFEGDMYTEHIEFFSTPNYVNISIPYKCQVEGDQWTISGKIPLKSLGFADYDLEITQVWRRIE